jgi:hypothetical protein
MHKSVLPVAKRAETVHELDTAKLLAVSNWLSSVLVSILPLIIKENQRFKTLLSSSIKYSLLKAG